MLVIDLRINADEIDGSFFVVQAANGKTTPKRNITISSILE